MSAHWEEIGNRLKAYRLGKNLTAGDMAERIGVSRAALYRLERGELIKIETLEKLADLLEVSLPSLMGVGVEYYRNAVAFFERMRQLEQNVVQVLGNFTPISILLLSDEYVGHLRTMLLESARHMPIRKNSLSMSSACWPFCKRGAQVRANAGRRWSA